ncbi:hypothetical protein FRB99_008480, partial [Tulasnella sp. 403]
MSSSVPSPSTTSPLQKLGVENTAADNGVHETRDHQAISYVKELPLEILVEVLILALGLDNVLGSVEGHLPDPLQYYRALNALQRVCQLWHHCIITTPVFWCYLYAPCHHDWLLVLLSRSKTSPLHISVIQPSDEDAPEELRLAVQRARTLIIPTCSKFSMQLAATASFYVTHLHTYPSLVALLYLSAAFTSIAYTFRRLVSLRLVGPEFEAPGQSIIGILRRLNHHSHPSQPNTVPPFELSSLQSLEIHDFDAHFSLRRLDFIPTTCSNYIVHFGSHASTVKYLSRLVNMVHADDITRMQEDSD